MLGLLFVNLVTQGVDIKPSVGINALECIEVSPTRFLSVRCGYKVNYHKRLWVYYQQTDILILIGRTVL